MHSTQMQWIIPDFSDFSEKRNAKDFVGYCRILTHFSVMDRRQIQSEETGEKPRSPTVSDGGFRTWAVIVRLSENVAFLQSTDEPDIGRYGNAGMCGSKRA